jgi:hypothetical protein
MQASISFFFFFLSMCFHAECAYIGYYTTGVRLAHQEEKGVSLYCHVSFPLLLLRVHAVRLRYADGFKGVRGKIMVQKGYCDR